MDRATVQRALANQQAMIDANQASLVTTRQQRATIAHYIDRLKNGDDLREILIERAVDQLAAVDALITQTEDQIRIMQTGLRQMRNGIEG
jgi:hypothetical protein